MRASVLTENIKRYWDARPCNVRHGLAEVGSLEWSKQVTARKYFVEPHILGFVRFGRWAGKRVLEIGCGIGTDTLEFARAGARVDAVDLSRISVGLARSRTSGLSNVGLFCADAEKWLPEVEGGYDLVYSFGVLHHMSHPFRALRRAHKRLKPGGELRIMLYARGSLKELLGEQPEAQAGCPVARRYTRGQAAALLREAGFETMSIERRHIFPWRIEDYVEHRYVKSWYLRWLPALAMRGLERVLGDHLLIVGRKA